MMQEQQQVEFHPSLSRKSKTPTMPTTEKQLKERSTGIFSLFRKCRPIRPGPPGLSPVQTSPILSDEEESTGEEYDHFTSDADSELAPSPQKLSIQYKDDHRGSLPNPNRRPNPTPIRSRMHRFWKNTFKRQIDMTTTSTGQEKVMRVSQRDGVMAAGYFEISKKSAFTPVSRSGPSIYPSQERRREETGQILLYPKMVQVKSIGLNQDTTDDKDAHLAVSFDEDCAQLVVQLTEEEEEEMLGVSFPHLAMPVRMEASYLGIQYSHPNWMAREQNNIWNRVQMSPMGAQVSAPPSPIDVETIKDDNWGRNLNTSQQDKDGPLHDHNSLVVGGFSHENPQTFVSARNDKFYKPICSPAERTFLCGQMDHAEFDVPFDELAIDKERQGLDPYLMMMSALSESGSYDDDETMSTDGWTEYSESVSTLYCSDGRRVPDLRV
jgi:hypothetical protein